MFVYLSACVVGWCFYKISHGRLRSGLIVSGGLFTTTQTGDNDTDNVSGRPASTQMTGNTEGDDSDR